MLDSRFTVMTPSKSRVWIEGATELTVDIFLDDSSTILGLTGIHNDERFIERTFITINTSNISHGGIGMLKLKYLRSFSWPALARFSNPDYHHAMEIIHSHLKTDRDLLTCQEDLLEAGLKEYARL